MRSTTDGLVVRGVTKFYPGTRALHNVDIEVRPGEAVALLGENGAGKSTLAGIVAGVTAATEGTMTWEGAPFAPTSPADAMDAGVGLIHQEMRLLPDLSVAENVLVGRWPTTGGGWLSRRQMRALAQEKLAQLDFTQSMDAPVRSLSVAAQQQVEIAKALMLDARLLILDEPTAALGANEIQALFKHIHSLKADGVSVIYVSHRLAEIKQIADRIVVLRDGEKVAEHDTADISQDELIKEMVGRSVDRLFPERVEPRSEVVLRVDGLSSPVGAFEDISFEVCAGEVFGIAGIVGAGRTELVRAITGADASTGTVSVEDTVVRRHSVVDSVRAGMVMIPEDRKAQGVIVPDTIQDNVALANLDRLKSAGWISPRKAREVTADAIKRFGVKGRPEHKVSELSGGNQQKVVVAKWLERDPKVVILDEPTRGIDVGARASIYEIIAGLSTAGVAMVVVSSDLDEVLGLSHRVMVLNRGRSRGVLGADEADAERVIELATT